MNIWFECRIRYDKMTENEEKIAVLQSEIDVLERGVINFYVP